MVRGPREEYVDAGTDMGDTQVVKGPRSGAGAVIMSVLGASGWYDGVWSRERCQGGV